MPSSLTCTLGAQNKGEGSNLIRQVRGASTLGIMSTVSNDLIIRPTRNTNTKDNKTKFKNISKGVQRPAAFAIVCFCFCEFQLITVSYSGSCGEQFVDLAQSMLVFVIPLKPSDFTS